MKRAPTILVTFLLLFVVVFTIYILSPSKNKEVILRDSSVGESSSLTLKTVVVDSRTDVGGVKENNVIAANSSVSTPNRLIKENKNITENPGCKAKTLHAYKAQDVGKVYEYPSLVHFAKLGHSNVRLNFREYTSVMAVYKFLKPEKIMFHTYNEISGDYWDKINSWKDVKIEVNKMEPIRKIGGKYVSWIQHQADYVKLTMVYKHGGTALDFDVIIVNGTRLKREQSLSECVLAEETDFINGGFYSCVKNASFMADWLESYETDYRPNLWLHNISYRPLNLLTEKTRKKCYNVHLDDTICLFPSWSVNREWLKRNGVKWRTKTAAHYFVKNGIPNDGEGLLKENFSLAEMVQYVHDA